MGSFWVSLAALSTSSLDGRAQEVHESCVKWSDDKIGRLFFFDYWTCQLYLTGATVHLIITNLARKSLFILILKKAVVGKS